MITKELAESAVEINSIFNNMSIDLLNKIPLNFKTFFQNIASKEYKFEYDKTKRLNEQNLLPRTKGIIALIYRDYLCSNSEKEDYNEECKRILLISEQEKQAKFNSKDIFKPKMRIQEEIKEEVLPIEYKKISILRKIFLNIKKLFKQQ